MDEKYKSFIDWYVTPAENRHPQTLPEWGKLHNCSPSEIKSFYNQPSFPDDVADAAIRWGYSKIPELLQATYKQFLVSKSPQLLMAYKELLRINKKDPGSTTNVNILQITDDKYARIIARESKRFGAREVSALTAGSKE